MAIQTIGEFMITRISSIHPTALDVVPSKESRCLDIFYAFLDSKAHAGEDRNEYAVEGLIFITVFYENASFIHS